MCVILCKERQSFLVLVLLWNYAEAIHQNLVRSKDRPVKALTWVSLVGQRTHLRSIPWCWRPMAAKAPSAGRRGRHVAGSARSEWGPLQGSSAHRNTCCTTQNRQHLVETRTDSNTKQRCETNFLRVSEYQQACEACMCCAHWCGRHFAWVFFYTQSALTVISGWTRWCTC